MGVRAVVRAAALGAAGRRDALPALRHGRRARAPARLRPDARGAGEGAGGGEGGRRRRSRSPTAWRRRSTAPTSSTRSRGAGSTRSPTSRRRSPSRARTRTGSATSAKIALATPDVAVHALPARRPRPRGHGRGDRRSALGRLRRGREPDAHRQGADGPDDGGLSASHEPQERSRRDRRQLADQGHAAPDRPRPVHRRRRDLLAHRVDDQGRLGRRDRARERPAGRVHPAPLGARRPRAARGAARRLRRRQPGRDRLRARAEPRERLPPARHRPPRRLRRHAGGGRGRRPGLRQPVEADRLVHGRADGAAAARRGRLGRRSRTPAGAGGASSRRRRRSGSSRRTRSGR